MRQTLSQQRLIYLPPDEGGLQCIVGEDGWLHTVSDVGSLNVTQTRIRVGHGHVDKRSIQPVLSGFKPTALKLCNQSTHNHN